MENVYKKITNNYHINKDSIKKISLESAAYAEICRGGTKAASGGPKLPKG